MSQSVRAFQGVVVDESTGYGNDADGWTGSRGNGRYYANQTCNDWTTTNAQGTATECDIRFWIF